MQAKEQDLKPVTGLGEVSSKAHQGKRTPTPVFAGGGKAERPPRLARPHGGPSEARNSRERYQIR